MDLAALRKSVQRLAPGPPRHQDLRGISSGCKDLDGALRAGGLPRGDVTEIAGPTSSGKTALALAALARQTCAGSLVAFADARGDFYPPAAAASGADLSRLLVVRARAAAPRTIARAAEILAESGALSAIVVAPAEGAAIAPPLGRRLRAAARRGGAAIVVLARREGNTAGAAARIELARAGARAGGARRGGRVVAAVNKGSITGSPVRAEIPLAAIRVGGPPAPALPPATARPRPGREPDGRAPGARTPGGHPAAPTPATTEDLRAAP